MCTTGHPQSLTIGTHSPQKPQLCYVVENALECLILLPQCQDWCVPTSPALHTYLMQLQFCVKWVMNGTRFMKSSHKAEVSTVTLVTVRLLSASVIWYLIKSAEEIVSFFTFLGCPVTHHERPPMTYPWHQHLAWLNPKFLIYQKHWHIVRARN